MKANGLRVVATIPGGVLLFLGVGWLIDPASAADGLGMTLADGMGRSSQIGGLGAYFLASSAIVFIGAWTVRTEWLLAAALLVGGAAVMRTVAFAVHDAPFATAAIVVEVVMAGMLVVSSFALSRRRAVGI